MLRELMHRPAALFATALLVSLRAIADTSSYFQVAELVTVTMVWMFVRALRTGNAVWFVPVAACASLLFYEYETFKAVPFLGLPFVGFFALRALLWPLPKNVAGLWERTRRLAPRAIKPVVVITVVVLIGIGPDGCPDPSRPAHLLLVAGSAAGRSYGPRHTGVDSLPTPPSK